MGAGEKQMLHPQASSSSSSFILSMGEGEKQMLHPQASSSSSSSFILSMGEGEKQMLQAPCSITLFNNYPENNNKWAIMEGDGDDIGACNPTPSPSTSTSLGNSTSSTRSSSDLVDDASSSCSSSHSNNGPLYELSELMSQLPIKRGLSKYFQGKSQSYTSLSKVRSIEDLAKKETPYQRKMKACKSYGGGLDNYKSYTLPKRTISKKVVSRGHSFSSLLSPPTRRGSFLGANRLPPIPVHKT